MNLIQRIVDWIYEQYRRPLTVVMVAGCSIPRRHISHARGMKEALQISEDWCKNHFAGRARILSGHRTMNEKEIEREFFDPKPCWLVKRGGNNARKN